jgi:hypothetical protein
MAFPGEVYAELVLYIAAQTREATTWNFGDASSEIYVQHVMFTKLYTMDVNWDIFQFRD